MKILMRSEEMARTLERLAYQIMEKHPSAENCILLGIQRRGADLAARLAGILSERLGGPVALGSLDINLYRDDWTSRSVAPAVGRSEIPGSVEGKHVLLVDDVLFTGRTVRAALEAIADYGRPRTVELLVLVDRGHRELPIQADYVGMKIATARSEKVNVCVTGHDGRDEVCLLKEGEDQAGISK
ncbi:MAG: bifunctional pyr operon transcriptional regulator/uracil phosphoribosyltransferase PyrR [Mailhella sp.]|nr:bifunctional pyr operon transcriptional regulator/uracil phosphoribosyltransferase PyrR [Mailhella sp.]